MKRIVAILIIAIVTVFAAACANNTATSNTTNATSNKNVANTNANSANSNSTHNDDHRMNMMNGNHSELGNRQMQKGMNMKP